MKRNPAVLLYHAIGRCPAEIDEHGLFVSAEAFEEQMRYLSSKRRVVPLADVFDPAGGPRRVAITFDDAYKSVRDIAVPILQRYGFVATVFAPTAHLGLANSWDDPSKCDLKIMDADDLKALAEGHDIQSHGHSHIAFDEP